MNEGAAPTRLVLVGGVANDDERMGSLEGGEGDMIDADVDTDENEESESTRVEDEEEKLLMKDFGRGIDDVDGEGALTLCEGVLRGGVAIGRSLGGVDERRESGCPKLKGTSFFIFIKLVVKKRHRLPSEGKVC